MSLSSRTLDEKPIERRFTDREPFLEAFDNALEALQQDTHSVIAYSGVGGIGKSRLIRRLRERLKGTADYDPSPPRPDVVNTVVDFQDSENRRPAKALERARARLHAQGVRFPTFDIAFSIYWKLANPNQPLDKSELAFLEEGEISGDVIGFLAEAPGVGFLARIPRFLDKGRQAVRDWWNERGKEELERLRGLDEPGAVEDWLPAFFGADLKAWLQKNPDRQAVLFVDTHEALWDGRGSGVSGSAPDGWLREWASHLQGILVVVGSRNQLRWAEANPGWSVVIDQQIVGGLSPEDADRFLEQSGMAEPELRRAIAGEGDDLGKSQGVPQYLDLAMGTYEAIREREGRTPYVDEFDENLGKLLERFLSYIKDARRAALFILSVPETFDRARFADLMATFSAGVPATAEGLRSITQFSFVDEPEPGRYALHALVREALAARHDTDDRKSIHRHLMEQAEAVLGAVDLRAITDEQRQALREATGHARALMEPEDFFDWYWEAEKPFDKAFDYQFLRPLEEMILEYSEVTLGPEHPAVLAAVNNLGFLLSALGEHSNAEPLVRRALDIRERVLGKDDEDTLISATNLGMLLLAVEDYDSAEILLSRVLSTRERILGDDDPKTLNAVNNLGFLLNAKGNDERSEVLYRRALSGRERVLRENHPQTLVSLNNLGVFLLEEGSYDEAESHLRHAYLGSVRELGEGHIRTLSTAAHLGSVLQKKEDYSEAETYYRLALAGFEEKLGYEDVRTGEVRSKLQELLNRRGK